MPTAPHIYRRSPSQHLIAGRSAHMDQWRVLRRAPETGAIAGSIAPAPGARPILIVEDDAGLSMMLALALEDAQYAVQIAANGADALAQLEQIRPRLILLDLRMPVMDGYTFLRITRERFGQHTPPIVVMTAYRDIDPEVAAQGLPILGKPMKIDQLLQIIDQHIEAP